jgi:hypothetical protein
MSGMILGVDSQKISDFNFITKPKLVDISEGKSNQK